MNAPRDRDLERLLADDGGDLTALYRRLPKAEPPRRLDRSVLGAAARATHGHTPRRQRWMVGFGSAAGIVLAAGVAWHVGQDALRREQGLSVPAAAPPAAEVARPTYVPVAPISEPAHRRQDHGAPLQPSAAVAPADVTAAPSKPAPSPPKREVRAKAAAKPPALREEAAPPAPPPPPPAAAAPEPQPFQSIEAEQPSAGAAGNADAHLGVGAASGTPAAPARDAARRRATAAPSPSGSVELRRDLQLDPETWLAHIEELLHKGRRQQAIESLRLFRVAHPQHPLPDELRALL